MAIPAGYAITDVGNKAGLSGANIAIPEADLEKYVAMGYLTKNASGATATTDLATEQKNVLKSTLDTAKDKELTRLDDILASRGVSRGGGIGAGTAEIAKNYADALTSGYAGINKDMASLDLQKQYQDALLKKMDAETKNLTGKTGNSSIGYVGGALKPVESIADATGQTYQEWSKMYPNANSGNTTTTELKNTTKKAPVMNYQLTK